jgi:hypothetical protein
VLPTKVLSSLTICGCLSEYMELIYCARYFYSEGLRLSCLRVMHLTARGRNYCEMELPRYTLPKPPLPSFFTKSILCC